MHAKERVVTAPVAINDSMRLHNAGHALGRGLAEATDRPTAIVALCDTLAAGVMAGLIDAGARVPEHVSMLGYGGHPIGPMLRPALSTVIPNDDRIAELGAQTLLKMIEGGEGASAEVPPTLEMRQSVADGAAVR